MTEVSEGEVAAPLPPAPRNGSLAWRGAEIPGLFGIRGIAAMAVVLFHLGIEASNGVYAVICFFVLSGFLITCLLLRELDRTNDISLRSFYYRRALRIFPAFYGYIACYLAGRMLLKMPIDWASVLSSATYTANYYSVFSGTEMTALKHTWSLSVEEQFYLLWPFLLWRFRANRQGIIKGLCFSIVGICAYRFVMDIYTPGLYVATAFETRADALAIGCLLGLSNHSNSLPQWFIATKWLSPLALVTICLCSALQLSGARYAWLTVALCCAIVIAHCIAHSETVWYRWLNWKPLRWLGTISYSLYLYHPFSNNLPVRFRSIPAGIVFAILLATGSYVIVERPFLRLKARPSHS